MQILIQQTCSTVGGGKAAIVTGWAPNKTINIIRFAHWEKASLSLRAKALGISRYCKRYKVQR